MRTDARGGRARRLLVGAGVAMAMAAPLRAQPVPPPPAAPRPPGAEVDPDAPLDPMPGLGVDWPDLSRLPPAPEAPGTTPPPETARPSRNSRAAETAQQRPYHLTITGLGSIGGEALLRSFREQSALEGDRRRAANAAQIDRRAGSDAELLAELLRSQSYYDASVEPSARLEGERVEVVLAAMPGQAYRFASVALPGLEAAGEDAAALRRSFAVHEGDAVVAQDVIDAGVALKVALGERGFAVATVGQQDIVVDHETHVARLVLPVSPGPFQRFGRLRVSGSPPFDARHVGVIARFRPGERYRQDRVDDLRRALIATGLVAGAEIRAVPTADPQVVDLDVRLSPAPFRTVSGELGYGTGEGVRGQASWQHRNFFNPEGALTVAGVLGTQEQSAGVTLRRSNWRRRDQALNVTASASHLDRPGYEARTLDLAANVERQSTFIWQKKWTFSLGPELVASDERDVDPATSLPRRRTFFIAALPGSLNYDGSDSLLDPSRGFRLGGRVSPELSLQDGTFGYTRVQIDGSAYRPLSSRVVAAGRIRLGTIVGAPRDAIAPSRRFYSGGGGSVRGYGYQELGPKDASGNPIGGRSLMEFALEARVRVGSFGIVPFLDGGTLSTDPLPSLRRWQLGTGIGVRYYSSFGPLRIDVGTPLNRRAGDSRIAVVVSLGQAF
ncbi:outer membrane protein assembly factor [Sphingomonas ginkgonis]|uniref:Outer membrane protein assembly factor n=1 Tax=Sphingomonas ginkgonis TaxID=2315330 RepID=A0A3R9YNP6_9SPHN|nr:BamA/TamA family outer membrane protein [Sphingomonas ginkgonis]RST31653.1 outer membrane protein assembly factor [Sphingomonas ginkgonis]